MNTDIYSCSSIQFIW